MSALSTLTRTEFRLFLREPGASALTLVLPIALIVIFGNIPAFLQPSPEAGGARMIDLYMPVMVALPLCSLAMFVAPGVLATYREKGILRRLATTPLHPGKVLAAQLAIHLTTAVVTALLTLGIGALAFAVPLPGQLVGFVLAFALCATALFALGLFVAAVAPTGRLASGLATTLFFPLMFFAGLWAPREVMPELLARIGDFTPLGAGVQALTDASRGGWPGWMQLAVLAGYTVVAGIAAARLFRWE